VTFLGWQSKEELAKDYQQASLFLFPSRHEGMPNAMLEAMSSGLPVVATEIAGNEELVVEGKTGFLVPSEDVDALRDALRKALTDSTLRERMGAASRLRVEKEYSWENVARQYSEYLEKIL
jgi:glycosyltransferase involved in cell wall biosynthesis